jgi:hypothetical protein
VLEGNMRRLFFTVMGGFAFLAVVVTATTAGPQGCKDAIDEYNSARDDIRTNLRTYANRIASNDGHDDCSVEFDELKSAQDDFESGVSNYEDECQ